MKAWRNDITYKWLAISYRSNHVKNTVEVDMVSNINEAYVSSRLSYDIKKAISNLTLTAIDVEVTRTVKIADGRKHLR